MRTEAEIRAMLKHLKEIEKAARDMGLDAGANYAIHALEWVLGERD